MPRFEAALYAAVRVDGVEVLIALETRRRMSLWVFVVVEGHGGCLVVARGDAGEMQGGPFFMYNCVGFGCWEVDKGLDDLWRCRDRGGGARD